MQPAALEPGQSLYLIQYGRLSAEPEGRLETGPLRVVGTELIHLATRGSYHLVRAPDDQEGWIWSARVTPLDPRVDFAIHDRALEGYLIGGMHEDQSGGSVTDLLLVSDDGLGELRIELRTIATITIGAQGRAEVALRDGARFRGALLRAWLITASVRVHLDKARGLRLDRLG